MRVYRRYTEWFELPADLVYLRFRQRAGYEDAHGHWITTDGPSERTGSFGKWHIVATTDPPTLACNKALPQPLPESAAELAKAAPADIETLCRSCQRTLRMFALVERFAGEESEEADRNLPQVLAGPRELIHVV